MVDLKEDGSQTTAESLYSRKAKSSVTTAPISSHGGSTPSILPVPSHVERMSNSALQASNAARNILLSGGSQAAAEAAAYSILVEDQKEEVGIFGRKKVNQAAKSQAALVTSMALLSANKTIGGSIPSASNGYLRHLEKSKLDFSVTGCSMGTDRCLSVPKREQSDPPEKHLTEEDKTKQPRKHDEFPSLDIAPCVQPQSLESSSLPAGMKEESITRTRLALKKELRRPSVLIPKLSHEDNGLPTALPAASSLNDFNQEAVLYTGEITRSALKKELRPSVLIPKLSHEDNVLPTALPAALSLNDFNQEAVLYTGELTRSALEKEASDISLLSFDTDSAMERRQVDGDMITPEQGNTRSCKDFLSRSIGKTKIQSKSHGGPAASSVTLEKEDPCGFEETEPLPAKIYFPATVERSKRVVSMRTPLGRSFSIISLYLPCYSEGDTELRRTIKAITNQKLPDHVIIEVLIMVNGIDHLSISMQTYLSELFGLNLDEHHPDNPFKQLNHANTLVVETNHSSGQDISQFHLSLAVKRDNCRKVDSQMWWLRSHAKEAQCKFALSTDCGIVFEPSAIAKMVQSLEFQPDLSAVTGYLRVMSACMQGDGPLEICTHPCSWFLRQLQSCDTELNQLSTLSSYDSIGFLPVLPGACTLYRFQHLVDVLDEYFHHMSESVENDYSGGIIPGNVQIAADRFLPVLLTFRTKEDCEDANITRPRTGFLRSVVFYCGAEKPTSHFVKQQRRLINGALASSYWIIQEHWIHTSHHSSITKLGVWALFALEIIPGMFVRLLVPAMIACGLSLSSAIFPFIFQNNQGESISTSKSEDGSVYEYRIGGLLAAAYLLLYSIFMIGHAPRPIQVQKSNGDIKWEAGTRSEYRPCLFAIGFFANAAVAIMFVFVGVKVFLNVGWNASPLFLRLASVLMALPYMVALLYGILHSASRSSIKAMFTILIMFPIYYLSLLWLKVWIPSYAAVRLSDLSWNEHSSKNDFCPMFLRHQALVGRLVCIMLVLSNILVAGVMLALNQTISGFLNAATMVLLVLFGLKSTLHMLTMSIRMYRLLLAGCTFIAGDLPPVADEVPK